MTEPADLSEAQAELIELYQKMYELTEPECGKCRAPRSCCDPMVCEFVADTAKTRWGVELFATGHPKFPLMANDGTGKCTAAPHLRTMCTLHNCDICSLGFKKDDPEWTERYWVLRQRIDYLEAVTFGMVFTS
jgi:hypothetical protein